MLKSVLKSLVFFTFCFIIFFAVFMVLIPKSDSLLTKKDFLKNEPKAFSYVALGDSLTEGIGDTTNQGGYIPLLSQQLTQEYGYQVTSQNFGVGGNTSNQILKRMSNDKNIKKALAKADLLTITVGGNDVMAVIRKNLSDLNLAAFSKASLSYQERLRKIIEKARTDNPNLPIYIVGIYNPFYLNFPELTDMQLVIDNWNKSTEAITKEYERVYFVPINDLLYKGIDGEEGIVQTVGEQTTVVNNALFSEDHFHPNNIGYQIMSNAVMEVIRETKKQW
ncbi:SGNH/GDSL hydrolase family protein [Streptococcus fryi]